MWGLWHSVIERNCVFYACLGKADLWFDLAQAIFQHCTGALRPLTTAQLEPGLGPGWQPTDWTPEHGVAVTGLGRCSWREKGFKRWSPKASDQNLRQAHTGGESQPEDFTGFPFWWHADTSSGLPIRWHTGVRHEDRKPETWGYNPDLSNCPNETKGRTSGKKEKWWWVTRWCSEIDLGETSPGACDTWRWEVLAIWHASQQPSYPFPPKSVCTPAHRDLKGCQGVEGSSL